jgi:hypothetical protein
MELSFGELETVALEHELGNQAEQQSDLLERERPYGVSWPSNQHTQSWFQDPYQIDNAPQHGPVKHNGSKTKGFPRR